MIRRDPSPFSDMPETLRLRPCFDRSLCQNVSLRTIGTQFDKKNGMIRKTLEQSIIEK